MRVQRARKPSLSSLTARSGWRYFPRTDLKSPRCLRISRGGGADGLRLLPSVGMSEAATLDSLNLLASGKVREMYEVGDRHTHGRQRPDLDLRRGAPHPDPRQGQGAHRHLRLLVRPHGGHLPEPPRLLHGRAGGLDGPRRCSWSGSRCSRSSAWCAATSPAPAGRTTRPTGAICGIELPEGLQESQQLPEPIFTPATKAESATTTRTWTSTGPPRSWATAPLLEELRRLSIELYSFAADARARARDHPGRHQVRVRPRRRRRDRAGRRGAHAGLLALLAGRRLRARPRPALLRQAVRARLGLRLRLGQAAAGAGAARRGGRRHPRALRGRLRADHRRAVLRLARAERAPLWPRPRADPAQGRASWIPRARPSSGRCRRSASTGSARSGSGGWSSSRWRDPAERRAPCASSCWRTR